MREGSRGTTTALGSRVRSRRTSWFLVVAIATAMWVPTSAVAGGATRVAGKPRRAVPSRVVKRLEADWINHEQPELGRSKVILDRRRGDEIRRRVVVDGSVDPSRPSEGHIEGGRFRRRVLEKTFKAPRGAGRPWSDADAPHLVTRARQGVAFDTARDRVRVRFFQPEASRVQLVIEGQKKPIELQPVASGLWEKTLGTAPRRLYGREYHFRVIRKDGSSERMADPFADFTERTDDRVISRFADLEFTWRDQKFKSPALEDIVLYEAHLPALSRHPSSGAAAEHRGTYRGAMSRKVMNHLKKLGVAVEFLPLNAADGLLGGDWGYWTTSFKAMNERYASKNQKLRANKDVMALIDSYHRAGIPVIFDVVYNHGGELHVRALGQEILYRKPDSYGNYPEGWPTVRSEHPMVRQMIVETLQHMVETYHVDGFRFDLGALLDKRTVREIDRRLPSRIHLFAEPWALGPTKWGKGDMRSTFADTRWAVWNDDFREPVKGHITGKTGSAKDREKVMTAIKGAYGWAQRPQQSVNYFSIHDGLTGADVVGGDRARLFQGVVLTLFSQGVPMIAEGTEFMHSKQGAHNSYNQPEVNQLDWDQAAKHQDLTDSVGKLIALRKRLPHFKYRRALADGRDIEWLYAKGDDDPSALGFLLRPPPGERAPAGFGEVVVLANGSGEGRNFAVPPGRWKVIADGVSMQVNDAGLSGRVVKDGDYFLHAGATAVLARDP
jgi:pullulanase